VPPRVSHQDQLPAPQAGGAQKGEAPLRRLRQGVQPRHVPAAPCLPSARRELMGETGTGREGGRGVRGGQGFPWLRLFRLSGILSCFWILLLSFVDLEGAGFGGHIRRDHGIGLRDGAGERLGQDARMCG